ncbi:MAG: short-chain dehydrogenase [Chloroflexi bacterium]|nr:short-chain dehydrogenase [Chloroflexota bacterium]
MSLEGKVVVVTGGAQGIGRHIARTFAEAGAKLAIADVAPFDNVVGEIEKLGAQVLAVPTDVRDEDQVRSFFARVWRHYGTPDILVNNAGIVTHFNWGLPRWNRVRYMEKSFFDNVMNTNLGGTFLCTKHVLPYMEDKRAGHIINLGQGSVGHNVHPDSIGACVYHVSKLSIRVFTQEVAAEEREFGICIVSMGPGAGGGGIATEEAPEAARQQMVGVEAVGNRYVLAAGAPMELSGHQVVAKDGSLAIAPD